MAHGAPSVLPKFGTHEGRGALFGCGLSTGPGVAVKNATGAKENGMENGPSAGAIGLPELMIILPWLAVLGIAIFVGKDANRRGMNGVAWGIGVALLCIVFLPIYLIVRKPLGAASAGLPVQASTEPTPAVSAGSTANSTEQASFCPSCGNRLTTGARFCARCGAQIPTA